MNGLLVTCLVVWLPFVLNGEWEVIVDNNVVSVKGPPIPQNSTALGVHHLTKAVSSSKTPLIYDFKWRKHIRTNVVPGYNKAIEHYNKLLEGLQQPLNNGGTELEDYLNTTGTKHAKQFSESVTAAYKSLTNYVNEMAQTEADMAALESELKTKVIDLGKDKAALEVEAAAAKKAFTDAENGATEARTKLRDAEENMNSAEKRARQPCEWWALFIPGYNLYCFGKTIENEINNVRGKYRAAVKRYYDAYDYLKKQSTELHHRQDSASRIIAKIDIANEKLSRVNQIRAKINEEENVLSNIVTPLRKVEMKVQKTKDLAESLSVKIENSPLVILLDEALIVQPLRAVSELLASLNEEQQKMLLPSLKPEEMKAMLEKAKTLIKPK